MHYFDNMSFDVQRICLPGDSFTIMSEAFMWDLL